MLSLSKVTNRKEVCMSLKNLCNTYLDFLVQNTSNLSNNPINYIEGSLRHHGMVTSGLLASPTDPQHLYLLYEHYIPINRYKATMCINLTWDFLPSWVSQLLCLPLTFPTNSSEGEHLYNCYFWVKLGTPDEWSRKLAVTRIQLIGNGESENQGLFKGH